MWLFLGKHTQSPDSSPSHDQSDIFSCFSSCRSRREEGAGGGGVVGSTERSNADIVLTGNAVSHYITQAARHWMEWNGCISFTGANNLCACTRVPVGVCGMFGKIVYQYTRGIRWESHIHIYLFIYFVPAHVRIPLQRFRPRRPQYDHLETRLLVCVCAGACVRARLCVCGRACVCVFSQAWAVCWWCKESLGGVHAEPSLVW